MPVPAAFVPIDRARLEHMARFLQGAFRVEAGYTEMDPTWAGSTGSFADRDRDWIEDGVPEEWSRRAVETTYAAARLGLIAVTYHAASLARLITHRELSGSLSLEAVARSAVETAGRSWWLLENRLPPRDRVARFFADQLYSAYRAEEMAKSMHWTTGVAGFSPTVDTIKLKCDELKLEYDANRFAPTVAGQKRPGSTPLVTSLIRETMYSASHGLVYALTSATTHGTHFALMRSYVESGDSHDGEPVLTRRIDHRQIEPVCGVVLEAFAETLRRVVQLTRWGWIRVDAYQAPIQGFLRTMPY